MSTIRHGRRRAPLGWLRKLDAYGYAPMSAERLACLRLLVGAFSLVYLLARVQVLADFSRFTAHQFRPVGVVRWLSEPLPPALVWSLWLVTVVLGVLFVVGAWFRVTGPSFAALLLWVLCYRNSWGMIFHLENLMLLHVAVLGLAASADAFSWDARAGLASDAGSNPSLSGRYGWPVRLLCAVTVATYLLSGIAKLEASGWGWLDGEILRNHIAYDALRKQQLGSIYSPLGTALLPYAWLFAPLSVFTFVVELGAPVAMLHRRIGQVWAVAAWSFHIGVALLMAITFVYPMLGIAFAAFFPIEKALTHPRVAGLFARGRIRRSGVGRGL